MTLFLTRTKYPNNNLSVEQENISTVTNNGRAKYTLYDLQQANTQEPSYVWHHPSVWQSFFPIHSPSLSLNTHSFTHTIITVPLYLSLESSLMWGLQGWLLGAELQHWPHLFQLSLDRNAGHSRCPGHSGPPGAETSTRNTWLWLLLDPRAAYKGMII